MGTSMLPQDQAKTLLQKLAGDDAFRTQFEADPVKALAGIGIGADTLATLKTECSMRHILAPKAYFAKLLNEVGSDDYHAAMSMGSQQLRLD